MVSAIRTWRARLAIAALVVVVAGLVWWLLPPSPLPPFRPTDLTTKHVPAAESDLSIDRVLFVTLDTLRADHLSGYGYLRETTPFLDHLARQGARFTNAFAHMPSTMPSHAAMFTGLYPLQNKVRKNGHLLDERFWTLAEMFRSHGFTTAAFVSLRRGLREAQLDQGFDVFDQPSRNPEVDGLLETVKSFGVHRAYRIGHYTVSNAEEWLEDLEPNSRFFLWVHLFDSHTPYNRQTVYALEEASERQKLLDFKLREQKIDLGSVANSEEEFIDLMESYDGEARASDRYVQRLVETLIELDLDDNLLIIVTSDHGEALGDHSYKGHGMNLYHEMTRVPLILFFSSGAFSNRTYPQVVRHIDLLPTLAELAGFEPTQVLPLQGTSLVPILEGSTGGSVPRLAFSQRRDFDSVDPTREAGEKFSVFDGRFKYIHRPEGSDEFYFLVEDPYETTNLIGTGLPEEAQLREKLLSLLSEIPVGDDEVQLVDEETIKALEAMGYVR